MILLNLAGQFQNANANSFYVYTVEEPELIFFALNHHQNNRYGILDELVKEVEQGKVSNLLEFTTITLNVMAELYEEVAIESVKNIEKGKDNLKLYRWHHATLNYAKSLRQKAELINLDSSIEITNGISGELLIIIDGEPFIITSPSIKNSDHKILEKRVVEFLCQINHCPEDLHESVINKNKRKIIFNADWWIEEDKLPAFVTRNGLHFTFEDIKFRSRKQSFCLELITDITLMADILKEANQKGIFIDWHEIKLEPVAGRTDYKLTINSFGDAVLLNLTKYTEFKILHSQIIPWLTAQVEEKDYQLIVDAENLYNTTRN